MAVDPAKPIEAIVDGERVAIRIPIDGRTRTVRCGRVEALGLANRIANAAVQLPGPAPMGIELANDLRLTPYDGSFAVLQISTAESGPLNFRLSANLLLALSEAARTALEHAGIDGSA